MGKLDVLQSLCVYDQRNPNAVEWYEEDDGPLVDCGCDNCFYGRTAIANALLELKDAILNTRCYTGCKCPSCSALVPLANRIS